MVSYGDLDPFSAIEGMRCDLTAQRGLVDYVYGKIDPLFQKCAALSQDIDTIKRELSLSKLENMFVSHTRFTEVSTDLKMEIKAFQAAGNSTRMGVDQATGQQISEAVESAFMYGCARESKLVLPMLNSYKEQMEMMRQEFNKKLNGLRAEVYQTAQTSRKIMHSVRGNSEVQELRAELKNDIVVLHDLLEQTALNAGVLAVAASDCTEDDRAILLQMMKQKAQVLREQIVARPGFDRRLSSISSDLSSQRLFEGDTNVLNNFLDSFGTPSVGSRIEISECSSWAKDTIRHEGLAGDVAQAWQEFMIQTSGTIIGDAAKHVGNAASTPLRVDL